MISIPQIVWSLIIVIVTAVTAYLGVREEN